MLHTYEIIEDQFTNSILDVLRNLLLLGSDTFMLFSGELIVTEL